MTFKCDKCEDTGWVCENCGTRWELFGGGDCCGAGKNCECNLDGNYEFSVIFASTNPNDKITLIQ